VGLHVCIHPGLEVTSQFVELGGVVVQKFPDLAVERCSPPFLVPFTLRSTTWA